MIAYANKIHRAVKDMLIHPTIAKSPTKVPSLTTPYNVSGTVTSGNIKTDEVAYRFTAINEYGETAASEEVVITVGTILDNTKIINNIYTPGILPRGVYYYGVTATNESGETDIAHSYYVNNGGTPSPSWADNPATHTEDGLLPSGAYYYAITSVVDGKETDLSSFQEVIIEPENSSVNLRFLAVEGASSYNIYGRDRNMPRRIGSINAGVYTGPNQVIEFKDNGSAIGREAAPTFNNTAAGIEIQWEPVEGNVKTYKIYGRTSPIARDLRFIAEVPANTTKYKDTGYIIPTYPAPLRNTSGYSTGAGVILKWSPVPSATGYRIYGRSKSYEDESGQIIEKKGYLTTIMDPSITVWTDTGIIAPDMTQSYPVSDSTQGTKGVLGSVVPDGVTLSIDESGILSVKGGIDSFLGNSVITNLKDQDVLIFDYKLQKWVNYDLSSLIFTLLSITDDTVVPKDDSFKKYKEDLINTLNIMSSFKDTFQKMEYRVKYLENCIKSIQRDIGKSFFPDLQEVEEVVLEEESTVTALNVVPTEIDMRVGDVTVLAIQTDANDFTISSRNNRIASTNKKEKKVSAKSPGQTTVVITATRADKEEAIIEIPVTIRKQLTRLEVNDKPESMTVGDEVVLNVVTDANGITLDTDVEGVVRVVSSEKKIIAEGEGTVTITARATADNKDEISVSWQIDVVNA